MAYFRKTVATPNKKDLKTKASPLEITSANKDRALGRLRDQPDEARLELFTELLDCKSATIKGFPDKVQQNLSALHGLRWMNEALSETETVLIRAAIALQLRGTVLPQVVLSLNHPDDWGVSAIQSLFAVSPIPMVLQYTESPYVRFYLKRSKIVWNVQQYDTVLFAGTRTQAAFIAQAKHTLDFSISDFLTFKQAGKRTPSGKLLSFLDKDQGLRLSFSRVRPDRNSGGAKGVQNYTRLLDVDSHATLTAHRPDGSVHDYDIEAWLSSAQKGSRSDKYTNVMSSLRSLIKISLMAANIIDNAYKVQNVFPSEVVASQWLNGVFQTAQQIVLTTPTSSVCPAWVSKSALWGPQRIVPLKTVLSDLVTKQKVYLDTDVVARLIYEGVATLQTAHTTLSGTHVRYDHIPQGAAVVANEKVARQNAGSRFTTTDEKAAYSAAMAISIPKFLDDNSAAAAQRVDHALSLPEQLLRDVRREWQMWCSPGERQSEKEALGITSLELVGAYRYLAKRFMKGYGLSVQTFDPWEPAISQLDAFYTEILKGLN